MDKTKKLEYAEQSLLADLCRSHSFVKKGNTFFRILGDGVLQAVNFRYERCFAHHSLNIGLRSLYQKGSRLDFSTNSCIPRYSVCRFINQSNAVSVQTIDEITYFNVMPPRNQIALLEKYGFDWLDGIDTQEQLVDGLCYLEEAAGASVVWNDMNKLFPYLASKNFKHADWVIGTILNQHLGPHAWTRLPWVEEDFARYDRQCPEEDRELLMIHRWIAENNGDRILSYLTENYAYNMDLCRSFFTHQ